MLTTLLAVTLASTPPLASVEPPLDPFFREPDRVQIFLADNEHEVPFLDPDPRPRNGYYVYVKEGPALKKSDREALAKIWVPMHEYEPRPPKKCMFNPDIALRFWRGPTFVDAIVCFSCEKIIFHDAKAATVKTGFLDDFTVLRKLAKQAFPEGGYHQRE